jgi:hypothetical protein
VPSYLIPADMLGFAVVGAVLLVMGSGFSTYIIDLRGRTESADRIHQLSFIDTMTGLPNRIAFNERLSFDAAEARATGARLDPPHGREVVGDDSGAAARRTVSPPARVSGGLSIIRSDGDRPAVTSTLSPRSRPSCTLLMTTLS